MIKSSFGNNEKVSDVQKPFQNQQKDPIYSVCEQHQLRLKYLNYNEEEGPILACKNCIDELKLRQTFRINSFKSKDKSKFYLFQQENWDEIQDIFDEQWNQLNVMFGSYKEVIDTYLKKINEILFEKYSQQIEQDQINIFNDIKSSINSYQNENLSIDDFEAEISNYFSKEKSITDINSKRYKNLNLFLKNIKLNFQQFEKELQISFDKCLRQEENENNYPIQPTQANKKIISENLLVFKKSSNKMKELFNGQLQLYQNERQIEQDTEKKRQKKPIDIGELESRSSVRMIMSKNYYSHSNAIVQSLKCVFPFSQNLKVLQIKNHTRLKSNELNEIICLIQKINLPQLTTLELDIRNKCKYTEEQVQYLNHLASLYPKIKNISLNLGKQDFHQISPNIINGLEPIKMQLVSFQLKIKITQDINEQYYSDFFEIFIREAKNLRILSLKFENNQPYSKIIYNFILEYLIQALTDHSLLQVLDISIPAINQSLSDELINKFANIIQKQSNLQGLRICFDSFDSFQYILSKQIHSMVTSLQIHNKLKCLVIKLKQSFEVDKQTILILSKVISLNVQLQEISFDFSFSNKFDDECLLILSKSIGILRQINKLKLRFCLSKQITDVSLNSLSKSLQIVLAKTDTLEQIELNFKNSKNITDEPLLNIIQFLSSAKNLVKLKLGFFKNRIISQKPLKLLNSSLKQGFFRQLRCIFIQFGSNQFEDSVVIDFLNNLKEMNQLSELTIYFGKSFFTDITIQNLIYLIGQNPFLKKLDINLFQSNAFTPQIIKEFFKITSKLNHIKSVELDFFNTKEINLNLILPYLQTIEKRCKKQYFKLKINGKKFIMTQHIIKYLKDTQDQYQDSNQMKQN